jgi:hypothetical protein
LTCVATVTTYEKTPDFPLFGNVAFGSPLYIGVAVMSLSVLRYLSAPLAMASVCGPLSVCSPPSKLLDTMVPARVRMAKKVWLRCGGCLYSVTFVCLCVQSGAAECVWVSSNGNSHTSSKRICGGHVHMTDCCESQTTSRLLYGARTTHLSDRQPHPQKKHIHVKCHSYSPDLVIDTTSVLAAGIVGTTPGSLATRLMRRSDTVKLVAPCPMSPPI